MASLGALQARLRALQMQDRQAQQSMRGMARGGLSFTPSGSPGAPRPTVTRTTSRTTGMGQQGPLFEPTMRPPTGAPFHPIVNPNPHLINPYRAYAPPNYHPPNVFGFGRTGY